MTAAIPLHTALATPTGGQTTLGDALQHDLTIIQLVRYFGCLPCQEWLVDLDRRAPALADRGIGALAIGGSADYQATWLAEERGVRIPLLLDPAHEVRRQAELVKPLGWRMADPRGALAYAKTLSHGYRPQAVTRDTVRSPAVLILGRDGEVRWRFEGTRIGHYPDLPTVEAAADDLP